MVKGLGTTCFKRKYEREGSAAAPCEIGPECFGIYTKCACVDCGWFGEPRKRARRALPLAERSPGWEEIPAQ